MADAVLEPVARNTAAAIALVNMLGAVFALIITPFAGVLLDHARGGVAFVFLALFAVVAAYVARNPLNRTRTP